MRSKIYCEVTCRRCGILAGSSGNFSLGRIKKLEEETADWGSNDLYDVICPECLVEIASEAEKSNEAN